jgi:regulator of protease activity HflC (stomatin/prohibitin superfamily)
MFLDFQFGGFDIVIIALLVLVVALIFLGVKQVPQGYNFTVERFGRYTKTLRPGLNLIVPFFDQIGARLNMMEQVLDVPSQEVITKDNATVTVNGVTFYQVLDAPRAAYEVLGLQNAIMNLTLTNIRTVMGSMQLDELLSNRDEINARLLRVVDAAVDPWGVKITRIEIKDIDPPRDLVDSMARQMKAERDKRAAVLEAEGLRQAEVLRADGEKQALVLEAEGRREAAFRDAEARERLAQADAKATEMLSVAIENGSAQAVNYFVAEKYVKVLGEIAASPNQKTLMIPLEAASVIGSVAGIGEIAKAPWATKAIRNREGRDHGLVFSVWRMDLDHAGHCPFGPGVVGARHVFHVVGFGGARRRRYRLFHRPVLADRTGPIWCSGVGAGDRRAPVLCTARR